MGAVRGLPSRIAGNMLLLALLPEIFFFLLFTLFLAQIEELGSILAAIELMLAVALIIIRRVDAGLALRKYGFLLAVPVWAVLSTLWSNVPLITLRYSLQFAFTVYLGLFFAYLIPPRRFLIIVFFSVVVFALACIASHRMGVSQTGLVLIGLTGSKNQIGYMSDIVVIAGMSVILLDRAQAWLRGLGLLSLALGFYILLTTNSATALLEGIGGVTIVILLWGLQRLPAAGRVWLGVGLVVVITPILLIAGDWLGPAQDFMLDKLNKDSTLTGRTELWAYADNLIAHRPILGYGYQAIWMGSEEVLQVFGVQDGRSFHFHHTFRQLAVDTGLIGAGMFVLTLIAVAFSALAQYVTRGSVVTNFYMVMFALMVIRAFADVIIGPFSAHTILFFACCAFAFWRPHAARAETGNTVPAGPGPNLRFAYR